MFKTVSYLWQSNSKLFGSTLVRSIRGGNVKTIAEASNSNRTLGFDNQVDPAAEVIDNNVQINGPKVEEELSELQQLHHKGPKIIKLSSNDTLLSKMLLKVKSKKTRAKSGLMMLEGKRLIQDACEAGMVPLMIFFSRKDDVKDFYSPFHNTKYFKTPYKDIQNWSDLTTSPGVIGVFEIPQDVVKTKGFVPVTVICDQIRDPGNLGSIIRNAAGAGVERIILTPGCTDLWDSKVLRAGTGAHFRVPILKDRSWSEVSELLPNSTSVLIADNRVDRESDYNNRVEDFELPLVPYYSINYNQYLNTAVVIGGETEGLSIESFHLAKMFNGARITVPLSNGLESLNSSHALCIILFEIRRQLMTSPTNKK